MAKPPAVCNKEKHVHLYGHIIGEYNSIWQISAMSDQQMLWVFILFLSNKVASKKYMKIFKALYPRYFLIIDVMSPTKLKR